jgi:hypothetical protein
MHDDLISGLLEVSIHIAKQERNDWEEYQREPLMQVRDYLLFLLW